MGSKAAFLRQLLSVWLFLEFLALCQGYKYHLFINLLNKSNKPIIPSGVSYQHGGHYNDPTQLSPGQTEQWGLHEHTNGQAPGPSASVTYSFQNVSQGCLLTADHDSCPSLFSCSCGEKSGLECFIDNACSCCDHTQTINVTFSQSFPACILVQKQLSQTNWSKVQVIVPPVHISNVPTLGAIDLDIENVTLQGPSTVSCAFKIDSQSFLDSPIRLVEASKKVAVKSLQNGQILRIYISNADFEVTYLHWHWRKTHSPHYHGAGTATASTVTDVNIIVDLQSKKSNTTVLFETFKLHMDAAHDQWLYNAIQSAVQNAVEQTLTQLIEEGVSQAIDKCFENPLSCVS